MLKTSRKTSIKPKTLDHQFVDTDISKICELDEKSHYKLGGVSFVLDLKEKGFSNKDINDVANFLEKHFLFSFGKTNYPEYIRDLLIGTNGKKRFETLNQLLDLESRRIDFNNLNNLKLFLQINFKDTTKRNRIPSFNFEKLDIIRKIGVEKYLKNQRLAFFEQRNKDSITKNKDTHYIKGIFYIGPSNSMLIYKDNFVYRYMNKEKYGFWKELINKRVPVEEIVELAESDNWVKLKFNSLVLTKNKTRKKQINPSEYVVVKSKASGQTIDKLADKNILYWLPTDIQLNLARQMAEAVVKLWDAGYCHCHLHANNFVVDLQSGHPEVKIIDFDLIEKRTPKGLHNDEAEVIGIFLHNRSTDFLRIFNLPESAKEKLIQYLEKKASVYKTNRN
ncbi:MAG: hypothetical protein WCX82_03825 [archaeon]|jgi:hypothetical protein